MGGSVTGGELTVGRLVRVHRGVGSVGSVVLSISPEERNTHRLADGQTRLPPGVGRARRSDHRCKLPGSRPGAVPISDDLQVLAPPEGSVEATISPAESPATHRLLDTHEISVGLVSSVVDFQAPAPDRTARRSPRAPRPWGSASRRPARYSTTELRRPRKSLQLGGCCDHRANPRIGSAHAGSARRRRAHRATSASRNGKAH